jgi:hypothetical protein
MWEDCIFESNNSSGIEVGINAEVHLLRPWFEANIYNAIYLQSNSTTIIDGSQSINVYANQYFIAGFHPKLLVIRNSVLSSTHASPVLIHAGQAFSGCRLVLDNNILPANFTIGSADLTWRDVQIVGMRQTPYRFRQTGVAANTSYDMPQESGSTQSFKMPDKGHILGTYTYYSGTISAGTFATGVKKNGSAVTNLNGATAADNPKVVDSQYYLNTFATGDTLQATVTTSVGFAATGGEFITEVIVAFGEDGL